ncbi:pyrroline-5-carboxylate reductase [Gordonia sinesedis]
MSERIAIVGGGKIGEALLAGLIGAGKPTKDLVVAEKNAQRASELAEEYGVLVTDIENAVEGAQYVFLAVKPDDIDQVLRALASADDNAESERVTVSLIAGLPLARYEKTLQAGSPVIRVMPNTPLLVNEAMSAVAAGRHVDDAQLAAVVELLRTVGKVMVVPEKQMDAVTAVAGSGPAYVFLMAEAMIDAGVALGLTRAQASEMAVQTIRGAGILMSDSGLSPVDLRAAVTSPGGTTAAAIRELEAGGLRPAFYAATDAAATVSRNTVSRSDQNAGTLGDRRAAGRVDVEGLGAGTGVRDTP